jgi:hypothetical protein
MGKVLQLMSNHAHYQKDDEFGKERTKEYLEYWKKNVFDDPLLKRFNPILVDSDNWSDRDVSFYDWDMMDPKQPNPPPETGLREIRLDIAIEYDQDPHMEIRYFMKVITEYAPQRYIAA